MATHANKSKMVKVYSKKEKGTCWLTHPKGGIVHCKARGIFVVYLEGSHKEEAKHSLPVLLWGQIFTLATIVFKKKVLVQIVKRFFFGKKMQKSKGY
jgi:hypothetical protein